MFSLNFRSRHQRSKSKSKGIMRRAARLPHMALLFVLTFGFLAAPFSPVGLSNKKASASHDCAIWLFDEYNLGWYTPGGGHNQLFFCPDAGVRYIYLPAYGFHANVSSFALHLQNNCQRVRLNDAQGNTFGGPDGLRGPGTWEIHSLRPYGWDNRFTGYMHLVRSWTDC